MTVLDGLAPDQLDQLSPTGLTLLLVQRGATDTATLRQAVHDYLQRSKELTEFRVTATLRADAPLYPTRVVTHVERCKRCKGDGTIANEAGKQAWCPVCEGSGTLETEEIPRVYDPTAGVCKAGEFRGIPQASPAKHRKGCAWFKGTEFVERECDCGLWLRPDALSFRFPGPGIAVNYPVLKPKLVAKTVVHDGKPVGITWVEKPLTPPKRRKAMQRAKKRQGLPQTRAEKRKNRR